jgi:hypothetical protein
MSKIHFYCPTGKMNREIKIYPEPVIYPELPGNNTQIIVSFKPVQTENPNLIIHLPEDNPAYILERICSYISKI